MSGNSTSHKNLKYYFVWELPVRLFHWINVICIIGLVAVGIVILNNKILGVSGDGKVLLKTVHVLIGYVFVSNLVWRIVWGFIGNQYARWKSVLPMGKGYFKSLKVFITGVKSGSEPQYLGHNPVGRLMVSMLFLLISVQAVTGLVLAGTDLYFPPFGNEIVEWIAETKEDQDVIALKPGSKEGINSEAYAEMRQFRKPFIIMHVYAFYLLLVFIFLHVGAVIITEMRDDNGLISAMFTGKKILSKEPVDLE